MVKISDKVLRCMAARHLKKSRAYVYNKKDIEAYAKFAVYMLENITLLERHKCRDENFETLRGICFPATVPVLFLLSSYRSRTIRDWYNLHKKLLQSAGSKIIALKGGKRLHLEQSQQLAVEINSFLSSIK